jgi:hypothetical protein
MINWFLGNWGSIASVIGLVLTLAALKAAGGAKRAAEDARRAIEQRTLAQELRTIFESVGSIAMLFDSQRWDLAAHSCYRAITTITFITSRWSARLSSDSREQLNLATNQLDTINSQLRKFRGTLPSGNELNLLSQSILRVNNILSAEVGKHEANEQAA